jgi:hypothetical protein
MSSHRTDRRVALALAAGEAKRIVRSVAFLLFLPLSVLALLAATEGETRWRQMSIGVAEGLVPLGWCLIALTNLAVLRDRRHHVDTMTDTMPSSLTARTGGHLLGGLVGVPVSAALLVTFAIIKEMRADLNGSPDLLELAVGLLIVAGAAAVGVAVGRWLPWALFSVAAIVATVPIAGILGSGMNSGRARFLGFVANASSELPGLDVRPRVLHLVWLLAWIGIVATIALARHSRGPRVWGAAALLVVVAIAAGVGQVMDISDEKAADRADLLNRPDAHQACETVDGVTYCAYPDTEENMGLWQATVAAVRGHVPESTARQDLIVSQRVPWVTGNSNCGPSETLDMIDATISDRVSVSDAWPADGAVHPGLADEQGPCGGTNYSGLFTAVQLGAWSVGLPPAQWGQGETCRADGQARSVIALWLGAAGGGNLSSYIEDLTVGPDGRVEISDWDGQPTWGVDWHPGDLDAAATIASLPSPRVEQVVSTHWVELIDPATPTARLFELLELPGPTTIDVPLDTCPALERS